MRVKIIVPCYNEYNRLKLDEFKRFIALNDNYSILFVDDGSSDNTKELILNNIIDRMELLSLEKNFGKAEAVRRGILYSLENDKTITYVAFWDADLAVAIDEIKLFFIYAELYNKKYDKRVDAIFGSRIKKLGSDIVRKEIRHWLSRIFVSVTHFFLRDIKSYDSQCGAKIFLSDIAYKAFEKPFLSKWIFDIEIQLRIKDSTILEYPVFSWHEIPGSKIIFFKTIFAVISDIFSIRKNYK